MDAIGSDHDATAVGAIGVDGFPNGEAVFAT